MENKELGKQLRNIWEKQDKVRCVNPAKTTNLARKNQISKKKLDSTHFGF